MNNRLARQDILDNLDKLPEKFEDTAFYNHRTGCMCFWGWVANVVGGVTPEQMRQDSGNVYAALDERYGSFATTYLIEADRIIRAAGGHPKMVADLVLADLITRGN